MQDNWEYELLQDVPPWESTQLLNDYGKDGWECYSVLPYSIQEQQYVYLFLKRRSP